MAEPVSLTVLDDELWAYRPATAVPVPRARSSPACFAGAFT